jgi:hypothetical protein
MPCHSPRVAVGSTGVEVPDANLKGKGVKWLTVNFNRYKFLKGEKFSSSYMFITKKVKNLSNLV